MFVVKKGGISACFDAKTGDSVWQKKRIRNFGNYYASPIAGDGKIYLIAESAGMTYEVGSDEVRLTPQWAGSTDFVTRSYAVPPDFLAKAHVAAAEEAATNDPFATAELEQAAGLKGRTTAKAILEAEFGA